VRSSNGHAHFETENEARTSYQLVQGQENEQLVNFVKLKKKFYLFAGIFHHVQILEKTPKRKKMNNY
jgi:hypothetical protein